MFYVGRLWYIGMIWALLFSLTLPYYLVLAVCISNLSAQLQFLSIYQMDIKKVLFLVVLCGKYPCY